MDPGGWALVPAHSQYSVWITARPAVTHPRPRAFLMVEGGHPPLNSLSGSVEFEELFNEVYPPLFRYCHRLTGDADVADDAAQEAFVRLHRGAVTGDPPALRVWLFRVATRIIQDRGRSVENRRRLLELNPVLPSALPDPGVEMEHQEVTTRVRGVLDRLDPRDRQLLLMREEGFSYREMADEVGVAPGSVGTLLARAQKRFTMAFQEAPER